MSEFGIRDTSRPEPDVVLPDIADYVLDFNADSSVARETARYCLMDSLGCALLALEYPACTKLLGPVVPGAVLVVPEVRVTRPVAAAGATGCQAAGCRRRRQTVERAGDVRCVAVRATAERRLGRSARRRLQAALQSRAARDSVAAATSPAAGRD